MCLPYCYSMRFTTLLNYHLINWLIDWWCNVCLCTWWFNSGFVLQQFDTMIRWIWTRIDYYPCISSEPTNQVRYSLHRLKRTWWYSFTKVITKGFLRLEVNLLNPRLCCWRDLFFVFIDFQQIISVRANLWLLENFGCY